jgi:hypothetical protein
LSNLFAKKNCYLFCITVTCVACSQAFFLCLLSSYLRISPLGAAIKGATSFSSHEKPLVWGEQTGPRVLPILNFI